MRWVVVAVGATVAAGVAGYRAAGRFERFAVEGESMLPAYRPGDWLVVDKLVFLSRNPKVGEVVVARDPREPARWLLKRVSKVEGAKTWLEGDNPEASTDSRHFGPVTELVGLVRFRYWRG